MGSSESTGRLNGTEREEEEERRQESGGGSTRAAAIAIAAAAATAGVVAAWGISRTRSNNTDEARTTRIRTHGMEPSLPNPRYTDEGSSRTEHVESVQFEHAIKQCESTTKSIWSPPPPGGYKMNTDGGFRPTGGQYSNEFGQNDAVKRPSAYAGILRNHHGECIQAFSGYIGVTDSLEAEIFGILNGLELLANLGLKGAILENDCDQAVFWIKEVNKSYHIPKDRMDRCKGTIDRCRELCRKHSIDIINIGRSANKCADKLAFLALKERKQNVQNHYVQNDLPDEVKKLVGEDKTAWLKSLNQGHY